MREKREYERLDIHIDIKYRVIHSIAFGHELVDGKGKAHSINLSEGGLLFETDNNLPLESLLEVELLLNGLKIPVYLKGEVVHIEEVSDKFDIGLKFEYKSESDNKALHNYLQNKIQ